MTSGYLYEPLPDVTSGLRLHLNENTDGCSESVVRVLRRVTREQLAQYPAYDRALAAAARTLGVATDQLLLTNGLDEGILTLALALLPRGATCDAVVVEPAYGMYGPVVELAGATVRHTSPPPDLGFAPSDVARAATSATRLVMLSNPNNPTGEIIAVETIQHTLDVLPAEAYLFVDEAYVDFSGVTAIPLLATNPRLIIGRTFAKSYGLAGLRIGCLAADPAVLRRLRGAIAPFSVNAVAALALEAALGDRGYLDWYLSQVRRARTLLQEACVRLGLPFWRSSANFVLVRVGDAEAVRRDLATRGIHVRNRSGAAGCDGCIRITVGTVEHTEACVAALEEVLCAVPR
jgi:histidinol-phosphate aminotransferase